MVLKQELGQTCQKGSLTSFLESRRECLNCSFSKAVERQVVWGDHDMTNSVTFQESLELCTLERWPIIRHQHLG